MPEATAVLFGIEDEFDVTSVDRTGPGQVQIIIEMLSREAPCPMCGVPSGRVRDRPLCRVKDLPASGQRAELWWRKRRLVCLEPLCPRRETSLFFRKLVACVLLPDEEAMLYSRAMAPTCTRGFY